MHPLLIGTEVERKYLVREGWPCDARGHYIRQGYLPASPGITLRVRWTEHLGTITVKTPVVAGTRWEVEYPIPPDGALALLSLCPHPPVEKIRHVWKNDGLRWEIDEFVGRHAGLILAEVELTHPWQKVILPHWVGEEVTQVRAFHNSVITRTASFLDVLALWRKVARPSPARIKAKDKGPQSAPNLFPAAEFPRWVPDQPGNRAILHRRHPL